MGNGTSSRVERPSSGQSNNSRPKFGQSKTSRPSSAAPSDHDSMKSDRPDSGTGLSQQSVNNKSRSASPTRTKVASIMSSDASISSGQQKQTSKPLNSVSMASEKQIDISSSTPIKNEMPESANNRKSRLSDSAKSIISHVSTTSDGNRPTRATSKTSLKSSVSVTREHNHKETHSFRTSSPGTSKPDINGSLHSIKIDAEQRSNKDSDETGSGSRTSLNKDGIVRRSSKHSLKSLQSTTCSDKASKEITRKGSASSKASDLSEHSRIQEVSEANYNISVTQSPDNVQEPTQGNGTHTLPLNNNVQDLEYIADEQMPEDQEGDEEIQKITEVKHEEQFVAHQCVVDENGQFNSVKFLNALRGISDILESEKYEDLESNISCEEMTRFVHHVGATVGEFQSYASESQEELYRLRETLKDLNNKIQSTIEGRNYKTHPGKYHLKLYV